MRKWATLESASDGELVALISSSNDKLAALTFYDGDLVAFISSIVMVKWWYLFPLIMVDLQR